MNLSGEKISGTYQYLLNQNGASPITLGDYSAVNWEASFVATTTGNRLITGYTFKDSLNNFNIANATYVAGGQSNSVTGNSFHSSIMGGLRNTGVGDYISINGGLRNFVSGSGLSIVGGQDNRTVGLYNFIGGGLLNTTSGDYSSIVGGRRAKIANTHSGAGVWADGQDRDHDSKGAHTCYLDFASGVYLRLPSFTGLSSQSGSLGQMAVSGTSLYVCTGTSSPFWGRIALSAF
jgi:hypothetical protein